jgi:hypothetical protein
MYYLSLVHLYQKLFPNLYYLSCPFTFIWADGYTYMHIYRYDPLIFFMRRKIGSWDRELLKSNFFNIAKKFKIGSGFWKLLDILLGLTFFQNK